MIYLSLTEIQPTSLGNWLQKLMRELIVVLKLFPLNLQSKINRLGYKPQGKVESWEIRVKSLHSLIMCSFRRKQNWTKQNSSERNWVLDMTCFFLHGTVLISDSWWGNRLLRQGELRTLLSEGTHLEWRRMARLPPVQPEKWNQSCWPMRWQVTLTGWCHFL